MKRIKLNLFLLLLSFSLFGQNIIVEGFDYLETDLTANTSGTMVYDQNGEKCALIKIRCNPYTKGFTFDVGRLGVQEVRMEGLEYWLYVPHGVRKISIQHEKLGFLDDYDFGMSVKKASTYLLTLSVNQLHYNQEENQIMEQYLVFSVEPKEALLEVDNIPWELTDGFSSKKLSFGTYEYRVIASDYHMEMGRVTLDNAEEKKVVDIKLRPAYGWLEISGESNCRDAVVYLDNKFMGKSPLITDKIPSGNHTLKIVKNKYDVFEQKIEIKDLDTLKLTPVLTGNFVVMELKAMEGSEIWVNGEMKGISSWSGEMSFGKYRIEAKKDSYYPSVLSFELTPTDTIKTIVIPESTPIYGKLDVVVTPNFSDVYVDGEYKGETPYYHDLIVGKHLIEVKSEGKASLRTEIVLHEGETRKISGELRNGPVKVKIESPLDVNFYIDGKKRGFVSHEMAWLGNIQVGVHEFEFRKAGYETQKMEVDVHYDGQIIAVPELEAHLYEVSCYVMPDGADVYVDNQLMGQTPLLLKLPMGKHQIEISKYGMLPLKSIIDVTADNKAMISGELKKASKREMEEFNFEYSEDAEYIGKISREDSINSLKGYNKAMQRFYYSAGKYEFTTLRVGGNVSTTHHYGIDASVFDFRLKMLEFSLLNFSLTGDYYEEIQYLSYCPTLRLHIPLTRVGTMFFGVAPVVTFSDGYITDVFYKADPTFGFQGDFGFRIDSGRAFGLDVFGRYRTEQGFCVGLAIHFSTNGKRARDLRNKR